MKLTTVTKGSRNGVLVEEYYPEIKQKNIYVVGDRLGHHNKHLKLKT